MDTKDLNRIKVVLAEKKRTNLALNLAFPRPICNEI